MLKKKYFFHKRKFKLILILIFLVVLIFNVSTASVDIIDEINPSSINITNIIECHTIRQDESKVWDFGNCSRNYIYINNVTKINEIKKEFYKCRIGSHIEIINISSCKITGFTIDNKKLYCEKAGWKCYRDGSKIIAKAYHQSNVNNPACSENSGERCTVFDFSDSKENKIISGYAPTNTIKELKLE